MEQQSFIERRKAACKNTWKVIGIDCSKLDEGIEIIKLQNIQDKSEHIMTISNRNGADSINIIFSLDGVRIGPMSDAINIVNTLMNYRGESARNNPDNSYLLTSLDIKAFLYVEMWNPSYIRGLLPNICYGSDDNIRVSDEKDFYSIMMNAKGHISTLIRGPNENEYYLFDTSDNLHQTNDQTDDGSLQADKNIYCPEIVNHVICLNKIPTPDGDNAEKSCKIQGNDCCMDWTMMFNAVIHKHKNIDEIIIGRGTGQPFLNPEILEETARRVSLINRNFIEPEYNVFLRHLKTLRERQQGNSGLHMQMLAGRRRGRSSRGRGS